MKKKNNLSPRFAKFVEEMKSHYLQTAVIYDEANIKALAGIDCDHGCLRCWSNGKVCLYTDFRYVAMVHRLAPWLPVRDIRRFSVEETRIGYESSISHACYRDLRMITHRHYLFDLTEVLSALRSVKTAEEIELIRAAERLDCEIWERASKQFRPGMTERDMAKIIKKLMIDFGDGEAFPTIVCVGANAAECHHSPDDTVWNGRDSVLVDMGVKLGGVCSDLTRNLVPARQSKLYRQVYDLVLEANQAAIAAARPGITGRKLDKVARDIIRKGGFGGCFGHSLGHGVGYEIHEAPTVSKRGDTVLEPGMVVTIEPGIYLEGNLGVRIEDMVLITESGCEVLSNTPRK